MSQVNHHGVRTWLEIDNNALANNYETFRKLIAPNCKLMAVAKSNAYGHGLKDYAKEMESLGADFIGVDSMTEAMALRKDGVKTPILILGYTLPELYKDAAENNVSITISSLQQLPSLSNCRIHLKIDTGMHRQGFYLDEIKDALEKISNLQNVQIEGIYTHFAAAKNPAFPADTLKQLNEFKKACEIVKNAGYDKVIRHAAATSGTIVFPESHFDMVRIGIGLYGLWPSLEVKAAFSSKLKLVPALSWRSIVSEIKTVKSGQKVGYDFTETFSKDSKIAVVPIGYWHGYRRALSSVGRVLVSGKYAKVLGRVSMDMIVIDISEIDSVKIGDIVTLIGRDGESEITAAELADLSGTSWYEIITQINPLIKKFYI